VIVIDTYDVPSRRGEIPSYLASRSVGIRTCSTRSRRSSSQEYASVILSLHALCSGASWAVAKLGEEEDRVTYSGSALETV